MKFSIKALRINAGMTRAELAKKMEVSNTTIANWETGKTKFSSEKLMKLADIFGVSVDTIRL